jgi:hypothetical protein
LKCGKENKVRGKEDARTARGKYESVPPRNTFALDWSHKGDWNENPVCFAKKPNKKRWKKIDGKKKKGTKNNL